MKRILVAAIGLTLAGPAIAGGYRVELAPVNGKVIRGHAGLHAVDEETAVAKVRLVAPGTSFKDRGTVRVLVLNRGQQPFTFGPDQVKLKLADGTELKPVPLADYDKAAELVIRESNRAAAVDMQTRNTLSVLAQQSSGGMTAQSLQPVPGGIGSAGDATTGLKQRTQDSLLPGSKTLDTIAEILMPEPVEPQKASGGYLVFDMPKELREAKADLPLTIIVKTGAEEHRFAAMLKRK